MVDESCPRSHLGFGDLGLDPGLGLEMQEWMAHFGFLQVCLYHWGVAWRWGIQCAVVSVW